MPAPDHAPSLRTPGRMADELGVALHRVLYVLATRSHIRPAARAGTLRLFDAAALTQVSHELETIATRRCGQEVSHA